jgi:putative spermidine/putrescine transport system substrate-binding protein
VTSIKRLLRGAALAVGLVSTALLAGPAAAESLRVLAWEGYADPDWVKEFTAETGIDVNVVFIGTDDEIWAKIKGSEGKDFDVIAVNTAQLQRYIDAKLVTPWDLHAIPKQKEVLPRFRELDKIRGETRDGKVYGIPFAFDSIGLIYNTDKVKPAPTSMSILWDPKYRGKVLAYDNGEHNFSFTALTMGVADPFHLTPKQITAVKAKLAELKKNVLSFYTTAD